MPVSVSVLTPTNEDLDLLGVGGEVTAHLFLSAGLNLLLTSKVRLKFLAYILFSLEVGKECKLIH